MTDASATRCSASSRPPARKLTAAEFAAALDALVPAGARVALAVSGGADSMGMLALGIEAMPERLLVLTVDHALRPESAGWAEGVAAAADAAGLPHAVLRLDWPDGPPRVNLQAEAREARYGALAAAAAEHGMLYVATAHHAEDQAETLLMRLARGAGVSGLAGIRASRPIGAGVTLVRPFLGWPRALLRAAADAAGYRAANDPANADPAYDRTAARVFVDSQSYLDPGALAASAAHLAAADEALEWAGELAFASRVEVNDDGYTADLAGLPDEIARRALLKIIAALGGGTPRGEALTAFADSLRAGGLASLAGVVGEGGARWRFRREAPRRAGEPFGGARETLS